MIGFKLKPDLLWQNVDFKTYRSIGNHITKNPS